MTDLRGYGDSSKPPGGERHENYWKRALALDQIEVMRCYDMPAAVHGNCEDYRAGATIDVDHASEDGAKKVTCPLLVLWGERGTVGRLYDVLAVWREHATNVTGKALPARHHLPEEVPDQTLAEPLAFLQVPRWFVEHAAYV
ncbi:MAG TPA: hypothetical protein VIX63_16870 [Vicinamibacterales bacterium]